MRKNVNDLTRNVKPTDEFVVPPFDPSIVQHYVRYFWWSWHPLYPRWSRYGTKGYESVEEAWAARAEPINSKLNLYHNKLVLDSGGYFTVVADDPCKRHDLWRKALAMDTPRGRPKT